MKRHVLIALVGFSLAAGSAIAQTQPMPSGSTPPPGETIPPASGGAGDRTGSITSTGQTKPPGEAASGERPDLDRKSKDIDRKINSGICTGC